MSARIGVSPLTGRIFRGRVNKAGDAFIGDKQDVTSDVMRAVIEKAEFHGGTFEIEGGTDRWTVVVTKQGAALAGLQAGGDADNPDHSSGASPAGTACSVAPLPEPVPVSALRVPPAGADRELLEAAARAAGIAPDTEVAQTHDGLPAFWIDDAPMGHFWKPLTDDGDALRLAVKLRLQVWPEDYGSAARAGNDGRWWGFENKLHGGIEAATRRAIVRAAAAMPARGIVSGEAGETRSGSTPKGQEPGPAGTRPDESDQSARTIAPQGEAPKEQQ